MRMVTALVAVFFVTMFVIHRMRPFAERVGLLDHPCLRKRHEASIPVVGGLGIYAGFVMGAVVLAPHFEPLPWLLVGAGLLLLVGTIDDYSGVRPAIRFAVQGIAALIPVLGAGLKIEALGQLLPGLPALELGDWSVPFTVFAVVGITNAMNLIDGMDGLAGMLVTVALLVLAVATRLAGELALCDLTLLLAMAVMAFLYFNWPRGRTKDYRVFLGDGGSTVLGYLVSFLMIVASQGEGHAIAPIMAPWLVAVPILDTLTVMICRALNGRSPFYADRTHIHHLMQSAGFTSTGTLYCIGGLSVFCAAVAVTAIVSHLPEPSLLLFFVVFSATYLSWSRYAWDARSFFGREVCRRQGEDRRLGDDRRQAETATSMHMMPERRQAERRVRQRRAMRAMQTPVATDSHAGIADLGALSSARDKVC